MFRKDFKIKSNVLAKNSEKKHIFDNISKFYKIDTSCLSNLFHKSKLTKIKIDCHNEVYSTVYQFDDKPLFFEVSGILVPTIYCLWLMCDFLMTFTIHEETVKYLINGSDLMIPGIIVQQPLTEKSYGVFIKNELVSINTNKNRAPVAVGMTNFDSYDMFMSGGKGKAVNILHVQGDFLWQFGDKSLPPMIDWQVLAENENLPIIEDDEIEANAEGNLEINNETETGDLADEMNEVSIEDDVENSQIYDADEILLNCFLHSIKCSLKDKDLPIILNLFYANHVLRFCPDDYKLDIKKTKYKKFGNFVQIMENDGIIKLSNLGKGIQAIKCIDRNHEKLRFAPFLTYKESKPNDVSDKPYVFPKIEEIYFITDKSWNLLKFEDLQKTDTVTIGKLREIVTNYVKRNDLQSIKKDMVQLDDVLKSACLNSKENLSELSWKTLFERLHRNMTPGITMTFGNEVVKHRNMKTPKIKMEATSKNNKVITRVEGAEVFQINIKQLCTKIQQAIGCSCGIVADKSGVSAIQAQGDQRQRIVNIFRESYKIPNNFIEDLTKTKSK